VTPSPDLFVLCMECLGEMISSKVDKGSWKPLIFPNNGPKISHLFFVDDVPVFTKAKPSYFKY